MKRALITIGIIGAAQFVLWWASLGLWLISDYKIDMFGPPAHNSAASELAASLCGILSCPVGWWSDILGTPGPGAILLTILNSTIWGVLFGLPLYALRQRFHRHATLASFRQAEVA